ncbi:MAG: SDR family oxidoreductase [Puniceicoccales bacterium]|jgi:enoyl-[acyl-carrier protein] reductase I|nr:SDR family oxidoreductase [Puniceicoccales bacterium]
MSCLDFAEKVFLVMGVANKKSIAWAIAQLLENSGAHVIYSVRSAMRRESLKELLKNREIYTCDVENPEEIQQLAQSIPKKYSQINGFVHSIAFGNYADGPKPFHETKRADFLQATAISCFSLVEVANALKPLLARDASVVTIGISSQVAAPAYGYMSPIKAALESVVRFLAKSFSKDSEVRFNCVKAGPLKTSASAGIPGYIANYLYAEKMTLRKRAITTQEVANAALFLLSDLASGINGQGIVVNAGMDFNYFDEELVH